MRQEIMKELRCQQDRLKDKFEFVLEHTRELRRIEAGMDVVKEWLINAEIDINSKSVDLKYSGDRHTLKGCFAALRHLGYEPNERPKEEKMSNFTTYFNRPDHKLSDLRVWLIFSSTKCTVVKVGTKMVEQAVYETVCE